MQGVRLVGTPDVRLMEKPNNNERRVWMRRSSWREGLKSSWRVVPRLLDVPTSLPSSVFLRTAMFKGYGEALYIIK